MPIVYADRVQETTTSTGTGVVALGGAALGFRTFVVGVGVGNQSYYAITDDVTGDWEVGLGTLGVGTFSRDLVLASSNSNLLVSFVVGNKKIFTVSPATFFTNALSGATHGTTNHAGIPGVGNLATAPGAGLVDHTTLNHSAIPGVPAPEAFTAGVHSTTDHTGITGAGGLPTPTVWGANTQTLGADKTLTDADPTIQFLNPNGGNYTVALPPVSVNNKQLVIYNTGSSGALFLRLGSVLIGIVGTGLSVRVYSTGLKWCMTDPVVSKPSTTKAVAMLQYHGLGGSTFYSTPRAQPGSSTVTFDYRARQKMPLAGTITGGFVSTGLATGTFAIRVNGVSQATVPYPSLNTPQPFTVSVPFAAGDTIAVYGASNTTPGSAGFMLFVEFAQPSAVLFWPTANNGGGFIYPPMNGRDNDTQYTTEDIGHTLIMPTPIRVIGASWDLFLNTLAATLRRNSLAVATINPTFTFTGVQALDVLYLAGDVLSYAIPSNQIGYHGLQFEWGGSIVCFAGKRSVGNEYLCAFTSIERTGPTTVVETAAWRAPYNGTIRHSVASGDHASNVLTIYINGIARKTINVGTQIGLIETYDMFSFVIGDVISVKAGAAGNRTTIQLWTLSE